ncbi:MAG TPA: CdaR family protein [Thermoanaerobaculia bacterium]|jgi:YbbR domain-containing protein|nr:CdaR family protein [Thermoanaerobaculia bacterium]
MNLSRILFRNLGTKLLALAIACATWFVLSGQRRERISERSYRIPLSIVNVPSGTMVVSPLPDAVDVRVRGAFTPLRALEPSKLEAVIDLADAVPGEKRYPLGPADINVPADVEVIAILPGEIRLLLDAVAEKTVPIVVEVSGQPSPGAHLDEVTVDPRSARIVGPAKTLARLVTLATQPVSVEGRDASFLETTTLALPAAGVRVREGQVVNVRVKIRPAPALEPTVRPTPTRTRKGRS